jgi:hypothetical protein
MGNAVALVPLKGFAELPVSFKSAASGGSQKGWYDQRSRTGWERILSLTLEIPSSPISLILVKT